MKLVLIGFGGVGQGLAQILHERAADLRDRYGFAPRIVGIYTRTRGSLYHADGLDINSILTIIKAGTLDDYPYLPGLGRNWDALRLIRKSGADVLVEVTPTRLDAPEGAIAHCRTALESGLHVVTANKAPVALAHHELHTLAERHRRLLRYEATVMSGTPSIRLGVQALAGARITEVRGILNGTTNYILTQMHAGMSYADALAQAQALGYAETDPTADVDGWDAAAKALILGAALFGRQMMLDDLTVRGIRHLTPHDVWTAGERYERWKLIVHLTPEGGSIQPECVPLWHPLAGVSGATNAISYTTDLLGELTLIGAGAGGTQTGFGLLSDLLDIHRLTTGR
jgi:homoserine dehydrogenase